MAKATVSDDDQILDCLKMLSVNQPTPLVASKDAIGIFPSAAKVKSLSPIALKNRWLEACPAPPAVVPPGKKKAPAAKPHAKLTAEGLAWLKSRLGPKQQLELLASTLEQLGQPRPTGSPLAEIKPMVQGLESAIKQLSEQLGRLEQREDENRRQLEQALAEIKPTIAKALAETTDLGAGGSREHQMSNSSTAQTTKAGQHHDSNHIADSIVKFVQEYQQDKFADCPMHRLYPITQSLSPDITIGEFHDLLRSLLAQKRIKLINWSGPLERMGRPELALFVGSAVMYDVSP